MEIISNRPTVTALTATPDDPRCRAVVARFGEEHQFYMSIDSAKPSASTPSMVLAMLTYGEDAIVRQLRMRTRFMVLRMDTELLNDEEIASIAMAIASDKRGRVLGYDLVLGFFDAIEHGEYELYAFKPRNIIEAWGKYVKSAAAEQERLKQRAESERREAERMKHDREYLRPEEFKKWKQQFLNRQES